MDSEDNIIDFAEQLARIRKTNTPKATEPTAQRATCTKCGKRFTRARTQRQYICPTCSRARQIDSAKSMKAKEGPYYERVVKGQLRFWLAESRRLGIFPDDDEPA